MPVSPDLHFRMPVLFIGHGSPMNMVLENGLTHSLEKLGRSLPKPRAIMIISAHWLTHGTFVTCVDKPRMIYDFYGFPGELYKVRYDCEGAPGYARLATELITEERSIRCDHEWGIDHASYSILRHMFPEADIPVFEMSLDYSFNNWHPKSVQYHYDLAGRLRELRNTGILVIGSGNVVHNLDRIDFADIDAQPYDWAVEIDEKIRSNLISGNHQDLINYLAMGKAAYLAVPTLDHYLPMIYAIALQEKDDELQFSYEGFQHGSISMRCFRIG